MSDEGESTAMAFCRYLSHFVDEGKSAALAFLSISVALCRTRGRVRQWRLCRYLSHYVGRGGECGFGVFVDICRIMSDEGEALAFLSITVVLCRSRWSEWLRMFCR